MANENDELRLMSLQEVATVLHVSPHTIRMWTRTGRINPTRICRRLLFRPDEVQRLITSGTVLATSSPASH
jgi:excisionase family DNA binding protein